MAMSGMHISITPMLSKLNFSHHTSKNIKELSDISFDVVITVCDNAKERCPHFGAATSLIHKTFPDPAKASGTSEEILNEFRHVRSLIKKFCEDFSRKV